MAPVKLQKGSQNSKPISKKAIAKKSSVSRKSKISCIACTKSDGRKLGIICTSCGLFYHKICINMSQSDYTFLIESNEFTCNACKYLNFNYTNRGFSISNDCHACFKTHKAKIIVACISCHKQYHRACVINHAFTVKEINKKTWNCMACLFPISQIEENDSEDVYSGDFSLNIDFINTSFCPDNFNLPKGFKIFHLNVNGVYNKLDQLEYIFMACKADIFLIAESHLNFNEDYPGLHVPGYKYIRKDRERTWGGLIVFFKEHLKVEVLDTPAFTCETESLALSIKLPFISSPSKIDRAYQSTMSVCPSVRPLTLFKLNISI
jgi:hypothetical protein